MKSDCTLTATKERRGAQNVLRESEGPTPYPNGDITENNVITEAYLILSHKTVHHTKQCTKATSKPPIENKTRMVTLNAFALIFTLRIQ